MFFYLSYLQSRITMTGKKDIQNTESLFSIELGSKIDLRGIYSGPGSSSKLWLDLSFVRSVCPPPFFPMCSLAATQLQIIFGTPWPTLEQYQWFSGPLTNLHLRRMTTMAFTPTQTYSSILQAPSLIFFFL
jgi:hypothetical protein